MAENLTPKKYIDSNNMKQILTAIKDKTPVGDEYVTEEQLLAKDYATKTYVGEQIANAEHLKREIVTVIPSDTEASDNVIYMLKVESATGNDKYQEYMKIDGTVQMVGDTSVDLTDYAKTSDIPTTVAELTDSSSYAKKTDIPTTLPANGGNADTVNNHTVKSDVPENAVFTDTIYDDTELNAKLNGKADKNAVLNSLEVVNGYTTAQIIPWSDGTHYRSFEDKSSNTYTDIVTNNGIALIARTENGVMTKNAEIATMDKLNFTHLGTITEVNVGSHKTLDILVDWKEIYVEARMSDQYTFTTTVPKASIGRSILFGCSMGFAEVNVIDNKIYGYGGMYNNTNTSVTYNVWYR